MSRLEERFQEIVDTNRFRIVREIAKVGMGAVYEAFQIGAEGFEKRVALKIILEELTSDKEFVGMFITGGRAPEYLRYDVHLMEITRHFLAENKPVAVVCHGAEIVATAGVIKGKRIATVAKCQFDVEICGAKFVNEGCVRDGNMVSGRTWHDNHLFMREFMNMLRDYQQANGNAAP